MRVGGHPDWLAFGNFLPCAAQVSSPEYFVFTLYVKDRGEQSRKVHERLAQLCFEALPGKHVIKVVDLSEEPDAAAENNIIAAPSVITNLPGRLQTFVGDLSNDSTIRLAIERAR